MKLSKLCIAGLICGLLLTSDLFAAAALKSVKSYDGLGQLVEGFVEIDPIDAGDAMNINRAFVYWPAAGVYHFNENLGQSKAWWAWEEEEVAWFSDVCPENKQTTFAFAALNGTDPGWIEIYINGYYALTFESGVENAARWQRGDYRLCFRPAGKQDGNNGVYYLTVPASDITAGKSCHLGIKVVLQRDMFGSKGWKAYPLRPYPYYGGLISERERMFKNQCYFALRDITWSWTLRSDITPLQGEKITPLAFADGSPYPPDEILLSLVNDSLPLRETPQICLGQIEQEPTLERAFLQWPDTPRTINFVAEADTWAEFYVLWNGMMAARGYGRDAEMLAKHNPHKLQVTLGSGAIPDFYVSQMDWQIKQSRIDGYLPGLVSKWQSGGLEYEMTTISQLFDANSVVRGDENQALLSRIKVTNPSDKEQRSDFWFSFTAPTLNNVNTYPQIYFIKAAEPTNPLHWQDGVLVNDQNQPRATVTADSNAEITFINKTNKLAVPEGNEPATALKSAEEQGFLNSALRVSNLLPAGASKEFTLKFLFLPVDVQKAQQLKSIDFNEALAAYRDRWTRQLSGGTILQTPEAYINDIWKAGLGDIYICGDKIPSQPGLDIMTISPCHYDCSHAFCAEVAMSLDYRGLHKDAQRYLEPFLQWQGKMALWPGFQSQKGVLGVPGDMGWINWTNFNGWILRALVYHARLSGDEQWYQRALPNMLDSCDWLVNELNATRDAVDPSGAPIAGLLPKGRWTDDPSEDYYFGYSDTFNYAGLKAAADLLTAKGHPRADELTKEAEEYRQAIEKAARWAAANTPKFHARGGEKVPFVPAGLLKRRVVLHPWYIVETASMNMIPFKVIGAKDEMTDWMLKVAESVPMCMRYGGSTSEPGYGPQRFAYLYRDEMDKYLESFYTFLASGFSRNTYSGLEEVYGIWGVGGVHSKLWELMRIMLVEETDDNGLVILQGIPSAWLKEGKSLKVDGIATFFGPVSIATNSYDGGKRIEVLFTPPSREMPKFTKLRLRQAEGLPLKAVEINGKKYTKFSQDWITLPNAKDKLAITVQF